MPLLDEETTQLFIDALDFSTVEGIDDNETLTELLALAIQEPTVQDKASLIAALDDTLRDVFPPEITAQVIQVVMDTLEPLWEEVTAAASTTDPVQNEPAPTPSQAAQTAVSATASDSTPSAPQNPNQILFNRLALQHLLKQPSRSSIARPTTNHVPSVDDKPKQSQQRQLQQQQQPSSTSSASSSAAAANKSRDVAPSQPTRRLQIVKAGDINADELMDSGRVRDRNYGQSSNNNNNNNNTQQQPSQSQDRGSRYPTDNDNSSHGGFNNNNNNDDGNNSFNNSRNNNNNNDNYNDNDNYHNNNRNNNNDNYNNNNNNRNNNRNNNNDNNNNNNRNNNNDNDNYNFNNRNQQQQQHQNINPVPSEAPPPTILSPDYNGEIYNLYVQNIPPNITMAHLINHFIKMGKLVVIRYSSPDQQTAIVSYANEKPVHDILNSHQIICDSQQIIVKKAKTAKSLFPFPAVADLVTPIQSSNPNQNRYNHGGNEMGDVPQQAMKKKLARPMEATLLQAKELSLQNYTQSLTAIRGLKLKVMAELIAVKKEIKAIGEKVLEAKETSEVEAHKVTLVAAKEKAAAIEKKLKICEEQIATISKDRDALQAQVDKQKELLKKIEQQAEEEELEKKKIEQQSAINTLQPTLD